MFINTPRRRFIFVVSFLLIIGIIIFFIFYPIYLSNNIIIKFAVHPFNICEKYPDGWKLIKNCFLISCFFSNFIISNFIYSLLYRKSSQNKKLIKNDSYNHDNLILKIGLTLEDEEIYLPSSGLFQNILVTGTIGAGKTSSSMYPFTEQLIKYKNSNPNEKYSNKLGAG